MTVTQGFVMFFMGCLTGFAIGILYSAYAIKSWINRLSAIFSQPAQTPETQAKMEDLKKKIYQAQDIVDKQNQLLTQLSYPSKNGLHSKWKNDLGREIQELERQKMDLFRDIVAGGYDPNVGVYGEDGQVETITMSEAVRRYDAKNDKGHWVPPMPDTKTGKVLHLVPNTENRSEKGTDGPR